MRCQNSIDIVILLEGTIHSCMEVIDGSTVTEGGLERFGGSDVCISTPFKVILVPVDPLVVTSRTEGDGGDNLMIRRWML